MVDPTTGDMVLSADGSTFLFVSGVAYIAQLNRSRIGLYQGEYFPNVNEGMPWFQSVLVKGYNPNVIQGAFRARILGTTGMISVNSLTLTFDNSARSLSVSYVGQSAAGLVTDQFLLPITPQPEGI